MFDELKIKDGENAYIVPFDMDFDVKKIKKVPDFDYRYNNGVLVSKWKKLLGNSKPKGTYVPQKMLLTEVVKQYRDMQIGRVLRVGERVMMPEERARACEKAGFAKIVKGE